MVMTYLHSLEQTVATVQISCQSQPCQVLCKNNDNISELASKELEMKNKITYNIGMKYFY